MKYDVALILSLEIKQSDKYVETEKISTDDYILEEIAADYMADLFKSDGIINTVNAQVGFWRRIIDHLKNLGKRLNTEGLERSKQVDLLAKRLESAVNRAYSKEGKILAKQKETEAKAKAEAEEKKAQREADKATAKANREAQKSTETNEKVEDEQKRSPRKKTARKATQK